MTTKSRAEMDREAAERNRCHVCGVNGGHRLVGGRDCPEMKKAPLTALAIAARLPRVDPKAASGANAVRVEHGCYQLVRVEYACDGTSKVEEISEWLPIAQ